MAKLCKKCGAELDQLTGKCPACGTEEQSASPKKRSRAALWAAVCLLLAVVGVGILAHLNRGYPVGGKAGGATGYSAADRRGGR